MDDADHTASQFEEALSQSSLGDIMSALADLGPDQGIQRFAASLDPQWIEEALVAIGSASIRRRKLPADQVVWLVLGMCLFADRSIVDMVDHLKLTVPGVKTLARSAVSGARARLGADPLRWLFDKVVFKDDNDGLYLGRHFGSEALSVRGGVITDVDDDGLDTLFARVSISDLIIRSASDKAVSINGGQVYLEDSLISDALDGVVAKTVNAGRAETVIERCMILAVDRGIVAQDKGSGNPHATISYDVRNSEIRVRPGGTVIASDYGLKDIHFKNTVSFVGDQPWVGLAP